MSFNTSSKCAKLAYRFCFSTDFCELQLIPIISSLTPITTAVPLIFVLTLTAFKDAIDDIVSAIFLPNERNEIFFLL